MTCKRHFGFFSLLSSLNHNFQLLNVTYNVILYNNNWKESYGFAYSCMKIKKCAKSCALEMYSASLNNVLRIFESSRIHVKTSRLKGCSLILIKVDLLKDNLIKKNELLHKPLQINV